MKRKELTIAEASKLNRFADALEKLALEAADILRQSF